MCLNDCQDEVVRIFGELDDWMDKYTYLIELGKALTPMDGALKTEANAISGCQSKVWMAARLNDGQLRYQADSDTLITKGLIALLLRVLNRQPPRAIVDSELYFLERIGLNAHLSPARANGLASIVQQMKQLAQSLGN